MKYHAKGCCSASSCFLLHFLIYTSLLVDIVLFDQRGHIIYYMYIHLFRTHIHLFTGRFASFRSVIGSGLKSYGRTLQVRSLHFS